MKKFILVAITCIGIILSPYKVHAETYGLTNYEISYHFDDSYGNFTS